VKAEHRSIVITGASGFVGRQIIPLLAAQGYELVLVGRSPARLNELFPGHRVCHVRDIGEYLNESSCLLHLAVSNSNKADSTNDVAKINVEWPVTLAKSCSATGVKLFLFCSSIHALDDANLSPYARSKKKADFELQKITGMPVRSLILAAVHGEVFPNKLQLLNKLPNVVQQLAFHFFSALLPTTRIESLFCSIQLELRDQQKEGFRNIYVVDDADKKPLFKVVSRLVDLVFALTTGFLLFWLMALIWLVVRLQSPGPGIFAQVRVGRHGEHFTCYKFRTMYIDTVQAGTHKVLSHSVTPIGAFLRKSKLDELPQIINILRNQMSLVGPRPCLPMQEELVALRKDAGVLNLKPGITGYAQVNGVDMSNPRKLSEYDQRYLHMRGLLLDFKIILRTFLGGGSGDRVKI
jgi:lipopolysaccharide/colanic/teichoic acid biosynthesis glycosyltransferase